MYFAIFGKMKVDGNSYCSIWPDAIREDVVHVIDQRMLPHRFSVADLRNIDEMCTAIRDMWVRGAPLIGAGAAWGMYLATFEGSFQHDTTGTLNKAYRDLMDTRPTAVNLLWALEEARNAVKGLSGKDVIRSALRKNAEKICSADIAVNRSIGESGLPLLEAIAERKKGGVVQILTHCNAGWLATVDYGTATAPIYLAHAKNIPLHVYVSETRPRNQGAHLTAWELLQEGIPHTLIADNASGYLMQSGRVDIVLVGTDRTTRNGDVVNKTGTYLKALAAKANHIPFYVALPSTSIDSARHVPLADIPIEERDADEVKYVLGLAEDGLQKVLICPPETPASNFAFDITPSEYISGLITERGLCEASEQALSAMFGI